MAAHFHAKANGASVVVAAAATNAVAEACSEGWK